MPIIHYNCTKPTVMTGDIHLWQERRVTRRFAPLAGEAFNLLQEKHWPLTPALNYKHVSGTGALECDLRTPANSDTDSRATAITRVI